MSGRSFRTFYLNQWFTGDEDGSQVTTDNWNRLADSELQMEDFAGEPCECGYDHAYGNFDSPALVVKFRRGDKRFVFPFIWVTPKTFEHRIKNENAAYDLWREQGLVMLSGTDMVDEQDIVSFIKQLNDRHPITHLTFDRQFKMRSLGKQLDEVLGSSVIIAQDPRAHILFPHMEKFERMVFNNLIVHDGNGLLSWQISNVKMERIGSMANPLPSKKASRLHIDAVMALFYSIACEEVEDSGASFRNMKAYLEKQGGSEGSTDEDIW
jgi:phage terminase large subunit-like protein